MTEFMIGHAVTYRRDSHPDDHGKPLTIVRLMGNNLAECVTPDRHRIILSTASLERVKQRQAKTERELHPECSFDTVPVIPDDQPTRRATVPQVHARGGVFADALCEDRRAVRFGDDVTCQACRTIQAGRA